jgi:nucleoside-diphosphate kinase
MIEKTLVLIKPDGVKRSLIGRIIQRFEDTGLKIIAMKMIQATPDLAKNHYFLEEEWAKKTYAKSKETYEKEGRKLPYKDHMELGRTIQAWNMKFLTEGPVIALVLEGPHAIELVRKLIGPTEPKSAPPGTIRGDFASIESYAYTDSKSRVLRNLIHASDSVKSADREIALWFPDEKMHSYKTAHEHTLP